MVGGGMLGRVQVDALVVDLERPPTFDIGLGGNGRLGGNDGLELTSKFKANGGGLFGDSFAGGGGGGTDILIIPIPSFLSTSSSGRASSRPSSFSKSRSSPMPVVDYRWLTIGRHLDSQRRVSRRSSLSSRLDDISNGR